MKKLLATIFCTLLSTQAHSADLNELERGTVITYSSSAGNSKITFDGADGRYFRFQYIRDDSKGAARALMNWTDDKGRTVRVTEGDLKLRFRPHDCWLEVGKCRFSVTNNKGGSFRMTQIAQLEGNRFTYELKQGRKTVEKGFVTIDSFGLPILRRFVDEDGQPQWTKRN